MLSVSDRTGRGSSRTRERSRSRDARAPSPAARAPSPRRSRHAYDSDSEAVEEESDRGYDRRDRRKSGYEVAVRKREESFDEDERRREYGRDGDRRGERDGRYSESKKYEYAARPEGYPRHGSYTGRDEKERERGYEERGHESRGSYYAQAPPPPSAGGYSHDEREADLYRTRSGPGHDNRMQYAAPGKYQYAKAPQDVKYLSKGEVERPRYVAKEPAEIEVERRRHRREDDEERERREWEEEMRHRGKGGYEKVRDTDRDRDRGKGYGREHEEEDRRRRKPRFEDEESDHGRDRERERERDRRRHVEIDQPKRERRPSHSRPEAQYVEIAPGGGGHGSSLKPIEHGVRRLSVSGGAGAGAMLGAGLAAAHHHGPPGGAPPGSPLLEAYHGTYQSISPMPSPMALPSHMDDGLSDLEPLEPEYGSDDSRHARPKKSILKKRVEIYDPEPDAKAIAAELKRSKPEAKPLIKILPHLSDDNMLALRTEYKKHFKVQGKGINIAKHIKVKYTGNIGKVAYATALGRWESEAHWANFWYQSGSSRRELLIEALIGRTNLEIRQIKEAFSDKRYNDSLEKCMQTELKKDKFRHAVLTALEERRQDDLAPLSKSKIRDDVEDLYKALVAKEGGETAMIDIIVVRSDVHLREVMKEFEARYKRNFAREMIQKSRNLVVS